MTSKTVLITGAARRIGAAIARHLHGQGMNVVIHYHRSGTEVEQLLSELNNIRPESALGVCADLGNNELYSTLIDSALGFKERLDALINNASAFYPTPLEILTLDQWQELMSVNLQAPMFLSQLAAPHLGRQAGCIINLTDIHGERPLRSHSAYSTSKAGLLMLTRSLALELAPTVRVNAISPGAILWPEQASDDQKQAILDNIALGRKGEIGDILGAVDYLLSHADYVTGQVLVVDGGRTLSG